MWDIAIHYMFSPLLYLFRIIITLDCYFLLSIFMLLTFFFFFFDFPSFFQLTLPTLLPPQICILPFLIFGIGFTSSNSNYSDGSFSLGNWYNSHWWLGELHLHEILLTEMLLCLLHELFDENVAASSIWAVDRNVAASSAQAVDGDVTTTSTQDFDGNVAVLHHMVTAMLQLTVEIPWLCLKLDHLHNYFCCKMLFWNNSVTEGEKSWSFGFHFNVWIDVPDLRQYGWRCCFW
jgi:hypothetical protein